MITSSTPSTTSRSATVAPTRDSLFRIPVLKILQGFEKGELQCQLPNGESEVFGKDASQGPTARMHIKRETFFKKLALYGGVGLGESYMDGDWDTDDLRAVISWFIANLASDRRAQGSSQRFRSVGWLQYLNKGFHWMRANTLTNSRRNIEEHYDLGNDFYQLWLDPSMTYSSARFTSPEQSLEEAQLAKYEALCQKLRLQAGDHVLEIGCGWGGFSEYAASRYGCRITAVTISEEQRKYAEARMQRCGLAEQVEIRLCDYRHLEGKFDKIVSIEMLEAVGDRFLEAYFTKCDEVLAPGGILAVQMITVPDQRYAQLKRGTDFIQRHIFPGSLLLSVGRIAQILQKRTQLALHEIEDLGASYSRTLRDWHQQFHNNLGEVRAQGFSEKFIRKWSFYLKYCEAAFATRNISVVQAVYSRPNNGTLHREDGVNTMN